MYKNTKEKSADSIQFKLNQLRSWNSVAVGWKIWWKIWEKGGQTLSDKLVKLAEIKPGQRVLDIAIAIDLSPEMLAIGRVRSQSEGLNIEFKEGDAEMADLPSSSFHAALCRLGLMFLPNLSIALDNIRRSLVSGGRLAAAVWAEPAKVPQLNVPMSIVRQQLQLPLPAPGITSPFTFIDSNELKKSLLQAGFRDFRSENIQVTFAFDSAEDYVRFSQEIAAPVNAMLANETGERKAQIWNIITDYVKAEYTNDNGHVKMDNEAICIAARLD